ncbi:sugar ABC transporter ATP-binding protein [Roseibium polysiphoniae]|uniref:Sugar ABC transporter ATP-binding protein n=1 Tax=Roseibium polysiphoniae TaxID=2571221 RepID=A0ABR9C5Q4_9HYPH|nr:sugar ABC transporter ATP-binding protein [Roseibium polysiphoniae]MBD8875236.1 sugar ABC transporter ATP-binding protein [Roseibium polysiphoniae]
MSELRTGIAGGGGQAVAGPAPSNAPAQYRQPVLSARHISKSFGDIQVLFGIDFDVLPGEVHALIGENGAGKSTLMKILSGYHQPTSGKLHLDAQEVILPPDGQAEDLGVVLIHQEFNLAEQLSVEENIFLGRELRRGWFIDHSAMRRQTEELLAHLNVDMAPDATVASLSVSQKQFVEIARALSRKARVLIMDEPTAVLTPDETSAFFEQIRLMRERGVGVVLISHKLDEVKELANRVTVLRDGHQIITTDADELTEDDMARHMVGRDLSDMFPPKNEPDFDAPLVLEVDGLSVGTALRDVSFNLRKGEILGFAGLIGSGRSALFEAIIGLRQRTGGITRLNGETVEMTALDQARDRGIAYLTKDRKGQGLLLNDGLKVNLTLFALRQFSNKGLIDDTLEDAALERAIRRFDIRVRDRSVPVGALSGGNQQKLLLGKVLEIDPNILIVDEPTRGIDVGTKQQIYNFIAALAAEGKSIVLISSEMPEIIGMSHRVAVMRSGRLTGILQGEEIEEHEIMRYATGLKSQGTADATGGTNTHADHVA